MTRAAPYSPHLLVTVILSCALLHQRARAQRVDFKVPPWGKQRIYGIATDSPMLRHFLKQPDFTGPAHELNAYFTHVEDEILASLRNGSAPLPTQQFRPCTVVNREYNNSVDHIFGMRGLPAPVYNCLTDVVGTRLYADRAPRLSVDDLFEKMRVVKAIQLREKPFLIRHVLLAWPPWARVLAEWNLKPQLYYKWEREPAQCWLNWAGFMRLDRRWHMEVAVGNAPSSHGLKRWARQAFQEYMYVGPGGRGSRSLRMRVPTYVSEEKDGPPMEDATTTFTRASDSNVAVPAEFYPVHPEANPALQDALAKSDLSIRQATDTLTPAGLSILLLPLVLNLVPIALLTKVHTRVLLIYMLFSDVASVVPLAIKGVELTYTGSRKFRSVAARVENNMGGVRGAAAAGQLWTAECHAKGNELVLGIAFVVLSLAAMAFGVWFELWAKRVVAKREMERTELHAKYLRICDDETYETYVLEPRNQGQRPRGLLERFLPFGLHNT